MPKALLGGFEVVSEGVAVHLQHLVVHVEAVRLAQFDTLGLVNLAREVLLKRLTVLLGILVGKVLVIEQDVMGDVVGLEDLVVLMDGMVDDSAHAIHFQELVQTLRNLVECLVDTGREGIVNLALVADDTRLHADKVILGSLAPIRILALAQELLGLEVIIGIILITQGDGCDIQFLGDSR